MDTEKAVIWFVAAILVLMVLLALVGNIVVKFVVPPPSQINNVEKLNITDNSLLYNIGKLPVTINVSALKSYYPQYLFDSNGSGNPLLGGILNVLKMNATEISPGAYWTAANLAGFLQGQKNGNKSFLIALTNNNLTNVTYYNLTIPFFSASPINVSYPPSDNISVKLLSEKIINTYVVSVIPSIQYYIINENSSEATVYYNIEIMIDYNGAEEIIQEASGTITIYQYQSGIIGGTYNIYVNLPTGSTVVPVTAEIFYYDYYGGYPFITPYGTGYSWKYYEYDVTLSIEIKVYNGTNPTTMVNGVAYNSRIIHLTTSCTIWSYQSKNYTINVTTYDHISMANYTIERTWHEILKINLTPNTKTNYAILNGYIFETIYTYTLNFSVNGIIKVPDWVFKHVPQEEIYANNYANDFLNGPAYYYGLAESLSEKLSPYQIFEIIHSIQSSLTISNNSWQNLVDVLRYENGTLLLIYYQIMPLLFLVQYHNFTCANASVLIGAFRLNVSYQPIIIENQTNKFYGVIIGALYKNYNMNISRILVNGTYTFYKWINYSAPPIRFETTETGNYNVTFAG